MSSRSTQHRRNKEERDEMLRSLGLPVAQRRSRSPVTNAPLRVPDDVDLAHNFVDDDGNDYDENVDYDEYDNDYDEYDDGGYSDPEDNLDPNPDDPADIRRKLASWHLEYRVSERAMNDLLSWLKEYHFPHLPKTVKSLKTEARLAAVPIQRMKRGQICHFGVKKMIMQILNKNDDNPLPNNCGHLQFGIDGVPIAKSSGSAFWPILIKLKEYADVLPVAVYHGSGKPPDVHEYMSEFVVELDSVLKNPIPWKNSEIRFELSGFIMDAPAKSYVLDIKGHTGFYACPKCTIKGESIEHRTTFPEFNVQPVRTDESFGNLNDGHHLRNDKHCPLATIGVGCVSMVPIDYMHNVLLGVFRSLVKLWCNPGKASIQFKLNDDKKAKINTKILKVKRQICSEFSRTPRPLKDIKWYKATEWRLFLLYLGPFVFLGVLEDRFYNNYLKLHAAIRILCHPILYRTLNGDAKRLIEEFATEFMNLYGRKYFVYNFHVLTHLSDECMIHGPLDQFSAFPFENYAQIMLHYVKVAPHPLQQYRNRFQEHLIYNTENQTPIVRERGNAFTRITNNKNIKISVGGTDRYVCSDDTIYVVKEIKKENDRYILHCNKMNNLASLYLEPINSGVLGIYCSGDYSFEDARTILDANEVIKVQYLNLDTMHGFIVILHSAN